MFSPKYKKWEGNWNLLIWQLFQWPLRSHLFPPPSHLFYSLGCPRAVQGTPQASLDLVLSIFMLGISWSWQESQTRGAGGRSQQSFSGMWDRWKDKHPWKTRRLEDLMCASARISLWCRLLHIYLCAPGCHVCLYVWAIYVIHVSCRVCVNMFVYVQ